MPRIKDKGLFYFLSAIATVIVLLLAMLLSAPPLIAEDAPPQIAANDSVADELFESIVGLWEGTFTQLGEKLSAQIEFSKDLNGHWLKMDIRTWLDSSHSQPAYEAIVYIRQGEQAGMYRAYLVDNTGSGQIGTASVVHGVWSWIWQWDDGTVETGTMVTSLPNRLTYESRINDKSGHPLPSIEMDMTRTGRTAQVSQ